MRFQNGFNKVVIELLVVQFLSEIILVISNQTRAARSFDFEITRMISDQIDITLMHDSKDVDFTWKSTRSQIQATHKLKSVDFRSKHRSPRLTVCVTGVNRENI